METWQIILAIIIVGLSIIMPIYYSSEKKKKAQQEEFNKIKKYGNKSHDLLQSIEFILDRKF